MKVYTKQEQRGIENKLMVTKGKREGAGTNQWYRINRYKLLYVKQISNKDLPYYTGNYTQYLVINYRGIQSVKNTESLCCTPETNTIW